MAMAIMRSWYLPEEIVIEILSRLPAKSIIRIKCICKRWYALTEDSSFIAAHLNNNTNRLVSWNGNNHGLITGFDDFHVFPNCIYNLQPGNLNFGFHRKPDLVLGPCDGIFCLYWKPCLIQARIHRLPTIALWNPATRVFSILPKSNFDFPPYNPVYNCILGFGFDLKTINYKVVKAVSFWVEDGCLNCAGLYTLHSDSWRVLPDVDQLQVLHISYYKPSSKYTNNGVFHLHLYLNIEDDGDDEVVLSFDMGEEVFRVTLLPRKYNVFIHCIRRRDCNLILLKDSLAVICSFFEEGHTRFEVWMMKDYEVEESWSLELSVEPHRGLCTSLGFWNNNELLILRNSRILGWTGCPFLYDPLTKQARDFQISGEPNFIYKESLVPLKGGITVN